MFETDNQIFSETKKALFFNQSEKYFTVCPNCNGKELKVRTVRKNKTKYYYCKICKKSTTKPIMLNNKDERINLICPACAGNVIHKGFNRTKKQRYRCCNCGKYTVTPKISKEKWKILDKYFCIHCNSNKIKKRGFDRYGRQVYYCDICKKHSINISISSIPSLVTERTESLALLEEVKEVTELIKT